MTAVCFPLRDRHERTGFSIRKWRVLRLLQDGSVRGQDAADAQETKAFLSVSSNELSLAWDLQN